MKVVLQRVKNAYVEVDGNKISEIDQGLLLLWGIEQGDSDSDSLVLINKILNFRIFSDENLKMNKSIIDVDGEILLVSQFTLAGNFLKGNRPSFINAKDPKIAEEMLEKVYKKLSEKVITKLGSFGSMMQVGLINDGPSTFVLSSKDGRINS
ncbi:MAG: D-aminoacyl-tRNA deacylase [Candidatus Actinomarina sp.]|jgi:D-tyrosyl-tRNA(Tyr) deacylase|nr:D-tyrosyl-tRNA(Tyr) deacylase [Candidatus Actinomarinales bacterium]|tara:strand:- start:5272 stop:5727 length:456 start_codon:yes stop_codon:yes gene_type:complete